MHLYTITEKSLEKLIVKENNKMTKVKEILNQNIVQTALWIGGSAAVMAICSYLLQKPELVAYYGVLNFIVYALKDLNDKRQEK